MTRKSLAERLFRELADGELHSGVELARALGVTRAAVWKATAALRALGAEVEAVPNRGYRLAAATQPLEAAVIRRALPTAMRSRIERLAVAWQIDSTNTRLLESPPPPPGQYEVLLAEAQTAGRGRRGRSWIAPLGGGLCLSVGTTLDPLPPDAGALSLCVGLAAAQALASCGARGVRLKWPNDLVDGQRRKLGGILIELRAEAGGPSQVVIGLGLNLQLTREARRHVARSGTRATDVAALGARRLERNAVAAALVAEIVRGVDRFVREGFAGRLEDWSRLDALRDLPVVVRGARDTRNGIARGVDADGSLLLETGGRRVPVIAGEVSVRADDAAAAAATP